MKTYFLTCATALLTSVSQAQVVPVDLNGDGTFSAFLDARTGLLWSNDNAIPNSNFADALAAVAALTTEGVTIWRLPTMNEFQSLAATQGTISGSMSITPFANAHAASYWTTDIDQVNVGKRLAFIPSTPTVQSLSYFETTVLDGVWAVSPYAPSSLSLLVGWNLRGNSRTTSIDVATTFGDATRITTVWKWNKVAGKWAFHAPSMASATLASYAQSKGYDVLTSIDPKEGFWVNALTATTLARPVDTGAILAESDLQPGWNLMSSADNLTPSQLNQGLRNSLSAVKNAIVTTWTWDAQAAKWKFYAPSLDLKAGTALPDYLTSKGYLPFAAALSTSDGFWVNVGAATPMPVLPTSYENKNSIQLDVPKLPQIWDIPGVTLETGEQNIGERALAFADFLQDGTYSAIATTTFYKGAFPGSNPGQWPDSPAKIYLLRQDASGTWSDVTAQLIKNPSERYICVSPGFIEIADLNNDGKPDAMVSCTGPDFTINGVFNDLSEQYVILSQPDGSYKVNRLPIGTIYAHQVTLADIDGDGNVDVLSVDPGHFHTPIVLWGKGDGTFTLDTTRFPSDMLNKAIYGIHAIPVDGKINVVVSGNPPGSVAATPGYDPALDPSFYGTKVLQYVNGSFQYVADLTGGIPPVSSTGRSYALALDAIYMNGFYYFLRVNNDYTGSAIIKTGAASGASTILTEVVRGNNSDTSGILRLTSQNTFVSQMGDCGAGSLNVADYFHYQCSFSVPLQ